MTGTYTKRLEVFYKIDFEKNPQDVMERPSDLMRWAFASLLLGKSFEEGRQWLTSQRKKPLFENRPVANFYRYANQIAAEILFGENYKDSLKTALSILPEVEKEVMLEVQATIRDQIAVALFMLAEKPDEVKRWRKKRMSKPVFEDWKSSAFEILYLSGDQAVKDEFPLLARTAARVSVETLFKRETDSIMPLISALAVQAKLRNESLIEALDRQSFSLDKDVFGSDELPKIQFGKESARAANQKDGSKIFRIAVPVTGEGMLMTDAYEVEALTTRLPLILDKYFNNRKNKDETDSGYEDFQVEGTLKLAEGIEISEKYTEFLKRRMTVGFEHAKNLIDGLDGNIKLEIKK